jgi:uncharacterized protein YciI
MKYYIIESKFSRPITDFREVVPEHRNYLQMRCDDGIILFSGPKATRDGEVFVAKAETDEALKELIDSDPYKKTANATYSFTSFTPTLKNPLLDRWL